LSARSASRREGDHLEHPVNHRIAGHWVGKTSAGIVCGFLLAIALSGLLARLAPGSLNDAPRAEAVMLSVPLVWTAVLSAAFVFRSGWRAWAWLGGASAIAFVLLEAGKHYA
jgi:hypothetical protein